jgi:isopenicillin-N epimerase
MKELFLLDPNVVFLNHGSFGACPRSVFEEYQLWQRRLEWQPVHFISQVLPRQLQTARQRLGQYLNVDKDDLVFVPNATFGVNVVARSLRLGPGDEVLATDHEYGACDHIWQFLSQKQGFEYRRQAVTVPVATPATIVEQFWQGVTSHTKAIFMSHITSPTALHLPATEICRRASEQGILTIIDGAHTLGQIPLDLAAIGADFYASNAHKWLCAPKGSAFLYTRPERQHLVEPLVVGWGWGDDRAATYGSDYLDYLQWLGTNDLAAYLAVPAAMSFQEEHDWPAVRQRCHALAGQALQRIGELTGLPPIYPDAAGLYHQMVVAPLPAIADLAALKARLVDEFAVEVPLIQWQGRQFIRISVQGYNDQEDIDRLLTALGQLLPISAA